MKRTAKLTGGWIGSEILWFCGGLLSYGNHRDSSGSAVGTTA